MKTLSFKIPEDLDARLTAAAKMRGESKSAVMREAIEGFVNGKGRRSGASALDLAGDLVGSVEGPGDLSCNKDYMKGFGK